MVRVWDATLWPDVYGFLAWRGPVPCVLWANERDWSGLLVECAVAVLGVGVGDWARWVFSGRVLLRHAMCVGRGLSRGELAVFRL